MRIAFILLRHLVRVDAMRAGTVPTEFGYGAMELAERCGAEIIEIDPHAGLSWVDSIPGTKLVLGKTEPRHFRVAHQLCERLNAFDGVVSMCAKTASALGYFAQTGRLRPVLVAIRCGVVNTPLNPVARAVQRSLIRASHTVLFGEGEYRPFLNEFRLHESDVTVNQFGVDPKFWHPGGERGDYVLSVGNDPQRDFATLLDAAPAIPAPVQIITTRKLRTPLPANVSVRSGSLSSRAISDPELRTLYQQARCVITPLRQTVQPSGQSSTLQAMACGTPVVLTRTHGLWSAELMRAGENVSFCAPGDAAGLAAAVGRLLENPAAAARIGAAARETVERDANIEAFARRLEATCRKLIEEKSRR